jgi:hypothetical protein
MQRVYVQQVAPQQQHQVIVSSSSSAQMSRLLPQSSTGSADWGGQAAHARSNHVTLPPAQTQAVMSKVAETPVLVDDARRHQVLLHSGSVGSIVANRRGFAPSATHSAIRDLDAQSGPGATVRTRLIIARFP